MGIVRGGSAQCVSDSVPLGRFVSQIACRAMDDMVILAHIRDQHRLSLQSYGRPRMTEELQELGLAVGHRRVGRLMRDNSIKIVRTRKFKATTDSNHTFNIAPNLLDQDFSADAPNQKWAGGISYIWTSEGWLYLAVILDLYSRRVIGWAPSRDIATQCTAGQWCSNRMKRDLAIRALDMALVHCPRTNGGQGLAAATAA
ncbi:transposase InsO family protein [Sulfitobacter undariae]|uniref:Transposase InsO family protein n=1 Tax=Sulfitobacter undariae TaxID=1563671 RepID=A0A7W6E6K9_9RHOB|nr:transposase InsO family protein [Sulfitobacter undariae]